MTYRVIWTELSQWWPTHQDVCRERPKRGTNRECHRCRVYARMAVAS